MSNTPATVANVIRDAGALITDPKSFRALVTAEKKGGRLYGAYVTANVVTPETVAAHVQALVLAIHGAEPEWGDTDADVERRTEWRAARKVVANRVRNGLNSTIKAMAREDGGANATASASKSVDERLADVAASVRRALGSGATVDQITQAVTTAITEHAG